MGNSASVTPKGTELAAPRPDIDVEICPPGTMAAMDAIITAIDPANVARWSELEGYLLTDGLRASIAKCRAILTAHRAQLESTATLKDRLTVAKPEPDYTSETEDLTTWPQTRGPEWRGTIDGEILNIGDVIGNDQDQWYEWAHGLIGLTVKFASAWTRRPAPEAQP